MDIGLLGRISVILTQGCRLTNTPDYLTLPDNQLPRFLQGHYQ
jgi:hypothetical protein